MKALRAAAKIEYVGKFAEGPAAAGARRGAAPRRRRRPRLRAGSGLNTADISKGMGLK